MTVLVLIIIYLEASFHDTYVCHNYFVHMLLNKFMYILQSNHTTPLQCIMSCVFLHYYMYEIYYTGQIPLWHVWFYMNIKMRNYAKRLRLLIKSIGHIFSNICVYVPHYLLTKPNDTHIKSSQMKTNYRASMWLKYRRAIVVINHHFLSLTSFSRIWPIGSLFRCNF